MLKTLFVGMMAVSYVPGVESIPVYVTVHYDDKGRLSLSGVEGPLPNGDAYGSCGQIDPVTVETYGAGWSAPKVDTLNHIWAEYHLNDLTAGTIDQELAIKQWLADGHKYDYKMACTYLASIGLLCDLGYVYGSSWLKRDVPADIVAWFDQFPDCEDMLPRRWRPRR